MMNILTVGDSWTEGIGSSNLQTKSWPAQIAKKYNVHVTNYGKGGSSIKRAMRIAVEEVSRNPDFDTVIIGLSPAVRTEVLNKGKWHQIWPTEYATKQDRVWTDYMHPWGEIQSVILDCFYFIHAMKSLNINLHIFSLSLSVEKMYQNELGWINDYNNDNDFNRLGMPLDELNIGVKDLDRKLKVLKAMHDKNLALQPDYLLDIPFRFFSRDFYAPDGHPNDQGYTFLADYIANKLDLMHTDQ
jgi:hypothetical protein